MKMVACWQSLGFQMLCFCEIYVKYANTLLTKTCKNGFLNQVCQECEGLKDQLLSWKCMEMQLQYTSVPMLPKPCIWSHGSDGSDGRVPALYLASLRPR